MDAKPQPAAGDHATPEQLRQTIGARFAVRFHVALILGACFAVGLAVTKLLLMAGVGTMWIRYVVALGLAYCAFLLGVRIWLRYAGFDRRLLPSRRRHVPDDGGVVDWGGGGGGGGKGVDLPVFRGGGGGSGGGGASAHFGGGALPGETSPSSALAMSSQSHSASGGGGFSLDFGDDGWVLLALIAVAAALFGAVVWTIYAAPTILADAAFAGMLSAGLVRSTRRIAGTGWIGSVVGHTWLAFAAVFVLAVVFALVAQAHFPDARTLADVVRRL
ncbi:MAG: hypothetical protein ABI593_16135 [Betaproteobacteria bacterium]